LGGVGDRAQGWCGRHDAVAGVPLPPAVARGWTMSGAGGGGVRGGAMRSRRGQRHDREPEEEKGQRRDGEPGRKNFGEEGSRVPPNPSCDRFRIGFLRSGTQISWRGEGESCRRRRWWRSAGVTPPAPPPRHRSVVYCQQW
jgi:hypothetical protein